MGVSWRMNERVAELRRQSLDTEPFLSGERAELITRFYREHPEAVSVPVHRALALEFFLENRQVYIGPGELLVGERGPVPRATPTYPELCCHSLEDLEVLVSRDKIRFLVSDEVRSLHRDTVIPYWRGKSMRDRVFRQMSDEWKAAYASGVFTEFMEQRAPGHTVLDERLFHCGLLGLRSEIQASLARLDYLNDPRCYARQQQLTAMAISIDAIIRFAHRHAEKAEELRIKEPDPVRRQELERVAGICRQVPAHAPRDFWEALQAYWFVHLGVISELNTWDAFSPGRLDQHLYPFYRQGLADRTLTVEQAKELLQCLWIKFNNQPAPPKVGVTAAESGTYADFVNINLGGLRSDGAEAVNDLSYLILDVADEMRLIQPGTSVQVSRKTPDRFLKAACRVIRRGWGQPAVFNSDAIIDELLLQGKTLQDARDGGVSGCVETGAFGKESYILTGYLNLAKVLELALYNGVDPRTNRRLGPETGEAAMFASYDELFHAFRTQLAHFVNIKIKGNNVIERMFAAYLPAPFLSSLIADCIGNGQDYNDGGARYNTTYIQGVGLGTTTDSLSAVRYHVFDQQRVRFKELLEALECDFSGWEKLRQLLLNRTPKYGNDNDEADSVAAAVFDAFHATVDGRRNTKGGCYRVNLLPTTCHVYFGSVTGAMPDGRKAGRPLSEGISPVQGADRQGPTAVIGSAARIDHARTGGTLLNMKFSPPVLAGEPGINSLAGLIRTYFRLGGHHVQFNVVSADTLRAARQEPEAYRDLIVRVAGYSDYFCNLSPDLQEEIITRTEHCSF